MSGAGGAGYGLGDTSVKTTLKYGLNPAAVRKKTAAKPSVLLSGPISAFAHADDDEMEKVEDTIKARGNVEVRRQQLAAKNDNKVSALCIMIVQAFVMSLVSLALCRVMRPLLARGSSRDAFVMHARDVRARALWIF